MFHLFSLVFLVSSFTDSFLQSLFLHFRLDFEQLWVSLILSWPLFHKFPEFCRWKLVFSGVRLFSILVVIEWMLEGGFCWRVLILQIVFSVGEFVLSLLYF